MKKILCLLVLMVSFICNHPVNAQPSVGVILDAPSVFTEDENKMQMLDKKLSELLPAEKCQLLPSKLMTDKAYAYRSAHNMLLEGETDPEKELTGAILSELGRPEGCNYILLLEMKRLGRKQETTPRYQRFRGRITSFSGKKSMVIFSLVNVRVVDVRTGQYEYKDEFLCVGKDSATKVFGIGNNPKESKTMDSLFEHFINRMRIKPTAIPS